MEENGNSGKKDKIKIGRTYKMFLLFSSKECKCTYFYYRLRNRVCYFSKNTNLFYVFLFNMNFCTFLKRMENLVIVEDSMNITSI